MGDAGAFNTSMELVKQLATLSGILAGFSFAALLQLIAIDKNKHSLPTTLAIIGFAISTFWYLGTSLVSIDYVVVLTDLSEDLIVAGHYINTYGNIPSELNRWGLILLLISTGISGWIYSDKVGIVLFVSIVIMIFLLKTVLTPIIEHPGIP